MTPPPPAPGNLATAPPESSAGGETPSAACDRLIDLLTRQRDLYRDLLSLSEQQQRVIAEGRAERLLTLLSDRQVIVDELTQINRQVAPLRSRMAELTDAGGPAKKTRLRGLVDEVQGLLESIIAGDDRDRQTLESSKASVKQQLAAIHAGPRAVNHYRQAAASPPRPTAAQFTDARG
ncbi:MAG: flagellar protein FlgN [Planctomycetota bacterium]